MKITIKIILIALLFNSCIIKEEVSPAPVVVDSRTLQGTVVFWIAHDPSTTISIYVNGVIQGRITKYRPTGTAPECGAQGFVDYKALDGAYNFTAREEKTNGSVWEGVFNVRGGKCTSFKLNK